MTAKTHKQYSCSFALLGAMLLYQTHALSINYYISLPVILLVSKYGALFPDVDHSWQNVKDKTVPNWIINKIIHITGGKHRSWQTHSIDIVAIFTILSWFVPSILYDKSILSLVDSEILKLILFSFSCGWVSHIVSDMLTSSGVRVVCFVPFKLALVPKKIGRLRFNTGNDWEMFCYKTTRYINVFIGIVALAYPIINNPRAIGAIHSLIPILQ